VIEHFLLHHVPPLYPAILELFFSECSISCSTQPREIVLEVFALVSYAYCIINKEELETF